MSMKVQSKPTGGTVSHVTGDNFVLGIGLEKEFITVLRFLTLGKLNAAFVPKKGALWIRFIQIKIRTFVLDPDSFPNPVIRILD